MRPAKTTGDTSTDHLPKDGYQRQYFMIDADFRDNRETSISLINAEHLLPGNAKALLRPISGQRGFPVYCQTPSIQFGTVPKDLQKFYGYWLISNRAKQVFETVAPGDFVFQQCTTQLRSGATGPEYWLCDIRTALDAVDEKLSKVTICKEPSGRRYYSLTGAFHLVFRPDVIGHRHIFILAFCPTNAVCDNRFKAACQAAKLTGLLFRKPSR